MSSWNTSLICVLALAISAANVHAQPANKKSAPAQAAPAAAKPGAKDDKVDVSDLENKYWAPKDTDFSVVQNRTYTKEHRYFLNIGYGPILNDKYSDGNNIALTGNYFFNERYGVQLSYMKSNFTESEVVTNLQTQFSTGVMPNFGRMQNYYGVGFNYVPFYAKMSLLGKKIMYFDMAITPSIGMTQYDQMIFRRAPQEKSALTYGLDFTQYFFLADWYAIRADFINHWYSEDVAQFYGGAGSPVPTGGHVKDRMNHTMIFLLGLTFYY